MNLPNVEQKLAEQIAEGMANDSHGASVTAGSRIIQKAIKEASLEIVLEADLTKEEQSDLMSCFACFNRAITQAFNSNASMKSDDQDFPELESDR